MTTDYVVPGLTRRVERRRQELRYRQLSARAAGYRIVTGVVVFAIAVALFVGTQLA